MPSPDHSAKPQGFHQDLDDICRRIRGQIRRRKKLAQRTNGGPDLLDYDRLMGSLKVLRTKLRKSDAPEKHKEALAGFLAFMVDDPIR